MPDNDQVVHLPDGKTVLHFPMGVTPDQIQGEISKSFPQYATQQPAQQPTAQATPQPGLMDRLSSMIPQPVKDVASGTAQGVKNIFSTPMMAIDPENTIKSMGTEAQGMQQQARQDLATPGQRVQGAGEALYGAVPGVGPWLYNLLTHPSLKGAAELATTAGAGHMLGGGEPGLSTEDAKAQIPNDVYVRGLGVASKLKQIHDGLKTQEGELAQKVSSGVDTAHPEGSIDAKSTMQHLNELQANVKTPENMPRSIANLYDTGQLSTTGKWTFETAKQMRSKIGDAMGAAVGPMKTVLTGAYSDLTQKMRQAAEDNGLLSEFVDYNKTTQKRINHFVKDLVVSKIMNGTTPNQTLAPLADPDKMAHVDNILSQYLDTGDLKQEGADYTKAQKLMAAKRFRWFPGGTLGGAIGAHVLGVPWPVGAGAGLLADRMLSGTGKAAQFTEEAKSSPFYEAGTQKAAALASGLRDIPTSKVTLKAAQKEAPASAPSMSSSRAALLQPAMDRPEWTAQQRSYEKNRLNTVLRNPDATAEEKKIAQNQLDNYK